jgi:hypothetical protein
MASPRWSGKDSGAAVHRHCTALAVDADELIALSSGQPWRTACMK